MTLYQKDGTGTPAALPERIRLPGGGTRTDSSTFTTAEIAAAGYTGPYPHPSYNNATQYLTWDNTNKDWEVNDNPTVAGISTAEYWSMFRAERTNRLNETDYYDLPNATAGITTAMKNYRQSLRDLPSSFNDSTVAGIATNPSHASWPSKP